MGLFISARTDNPIVSLIGTVALCGLLYLAGSSTLTDFFDIRVADTLRLVGSGGGFDSITRGVLDLRDLCYYLSLTIAFSRPECLLLERLRWSGTFWSSRHNQARGYRPVAGQPAADQCLVCPIDRLRLDLTEGSLYTISEPTHQFLGPAAGTAGYPGVFQRQDPSVARPVGATITGPAAGICSRGEGRVRIEFIDPAENPEQEQEANERFPVSGPHPSR